MEALHVKIPWCHSPGIPALDCRSYSPVVNPYPGSWVLQLPCFIYIYIKKKQGMEAPISDSKIYTPG